uniref:Uncharacterized protein n=1 Tax=Triticum urartu TaxID=4572 RepID=A0A8R7R758_TRIUA
MAGYCPAPPQSTVLMEQLQDFIRNASAECLNSNWTVHNTPRHLSVSGLQIRNQFLAPVDLQHEMATLLFRRCIKIFMEENPDRPYMSFPHILDNDLAVLFLAGMDFIHLIQIQEQFVGQHILYPLHTCQNFYVPVPTPHGWSLYLWDMVATEVHILDPLSSPSGCTPEVRAMHEAAVSILHDGLFKCISEFFSGWPVSKENWTTKYPRVADTLFSREDSAVCVLHLLRFYNGSKATVPLTKNNIDRMRLHLFHETFKLQGNKSSVPPDVMWNILAPDDIADETSVVT